MKRWTADEKAYVAEHYGLVPYVDMAEHLGRPWTAVRGYVDRTGLARERSNLGSRYSADLEFFSTLTPLSCYWAGFIAADGNVRGTRLSVGLAERDIEHLRRMAADLRWTGQIRQYGDGAARVQISCGRYVTDLLTNFSITERKSLTLKPPPLHDDEHVKAFITGLIDGDGSISITRYGKYSNPRLALYGTGAVLDWVRQHFDRWAPPGPRPAAIPRQVSERGLHQYAVGASRARVVAAALAEVDVPRLTRKWRMFGMGYDPIAKTINCDITSCSTTAVVRDNEPGENRPVSGRTIPEGNWTMVGDGDLLTRPERAATYCPEHG